MFMIRLKFTFIAFCEVIASCNLLCEHLFMIRLTCLRAQLSALVNANLFRWLVLLSLIFSCLNSPISSQQTGSKKNRFSETLASMIL